MSRQMFRLRTSLLHFTIVLACWLRTSHFVNAVNVTVQDTDPSIVYSPAASWHASSDSCSVCLNPGVSYSYHEAIHPAPTPDADDPPPAPNPVRPVSTPSPTKASTTSHPPTPSPTKTDDDDDDDDDKDKDKKDPDAPKGKRGLLLRRATPGDADDGQDPAVTISFNFIGSAIYLFGIQPLGVAVGDSTPTNMNLSFSVDNKPSGGFKSSPAPGSSVAFQPSQPVFSLIGLSEGQHQLVVNVGQNSSFIFDHLVYTSAAEAASGNGTSTSQLPSTPLAQTASPSPSENSAIKKHNIATFAGAVGGSVGVLGVFSLCLALSIIRRRRLAARRDRLDRESLHTNASDDSPNVSHMHGPAPFVPRYFPDTVIPPDPPTYMAAVATAHHGGSTLLASITAAAHAQNRSYADIPPASPPPPLEDLMLHPPPSFPEAISTPPPSTTPRPMNRETGAVVPPPSIPVATEEDSHTPDSVGSESSNSTAAPELVPLLQPSAPEIILQHPRPRPGSRASSRRSIIIRPETPDGT